MPLQLHTVREIIKPNLLNREKNINDPIYTTEKLIYSLCLSIQLL